MAGDLRISMLVELNAQRGRAEASALRNELDTLGKTARATGQDAGSAATGLNALTTAGTKTAAEIINASAGAAEFDATITALRQSVNPLAAALEQAEIGIRSIAAAEELGVLTSREAALAHDQLARSAEQIAAKMAQYGSSADLAAAANARLETSLQQLIAASTGMAASTGDSIAAQLQHGAALDEIRARFDPLFAASRRYEMELRDIAEAERLGAISASGAAQARDRAAQSMLPVAGQLSQVGTAAQNAGAYVTQLGFQANDVMMMLAAGQNPMMLAMQQGTQVSQVFQMMKADGMALGPAIKGALLSMLSPMSLVTMGAIALAAYGVQALMGLREETKSLADALSDVANATRAWGDITKSGLQGLESEFGKITPELVAMRLELMQIGQIKALDALRDAMRSLNAETKAGFWDWLTTDLNLDATKAKIADLLKVPVTVDRDGWSVTNPIVGQFEKASAGLAQARGPQEQLSAVRELNRQFVEATGGIANMSAEQLQFYDGLVQTEAATRRIIAAQADAAREQLAIKRAAGIENDRMGGPTAADRAASDATLKALADGRARASELLATGQRELQIAQTKATYGEQSLQYRTLEAQQARDALEVEIRRLGIGQQSAQADQMRAQLKERQGVDEKARNSAIETSAAQMITQLNTEAEIVKLTAKYGADSLEVSYARVTAERAAQVELLASQGVTGALADETMRAWDAARGIAAVNMAAGIGAAASEAILLAANLGISLEHAIGLMGLAGKAAKAASGSSRVSFGGPSATTALGITGTGNLGFGDNPGTDSVRLPSATPRAGTGRGGGGRASETNSVLALIAAEERELAVLRETDPVKVELLQKSEQLKNATTEQKVQLEGLIRARIAEKAALEAVKRAQEEVREAGRSAFVGLVTGTMNWRDALGQVLGKLAQLAANSAFDLLFPSGGSGSGGGGLVGNIIGSVLGIPQHADGGLIGGSGGPREDNHLIAASTGEYIVNAAATANALPLLQAINAGVPIGRLIDFIGGQRPAYADGGLIGSTGSSAATFWPTNSGSRAGSSQDNASTGRSYTLEQHIHVSGATGNTEIRETVAEGVRHGIELHDREVLPFRVKDVLENDRVSGR